MLGEPCVHSHGLPGLCRLNRNAAIVEDTNAVLIEVSECRSGRTDNWCIVRHGGDALTGTS